MFIYFYLSISGEHQFWFENVVYFIMDSPSSTTGGRRRLPTTHYAEDQAFDQIAKEVSKIIWFYLWYSNIYIFHSI